MLQAFQAYILIVAGENSTLRHGYVVRFHYGFSYGFKTFPYAHVSQLHLNNTDVNYKYNKIAIATFAGFKTHLIMDTH